MRHHIHALVRALLSFEIPPLPYCAKCGGHYPTHSH